MHGPSAIDSCINKHRSDIACLAGLKMDFTQVPSFQALLDQTAKGSGAALLGDARRFLSSVGSRAVR